MLGETLGPYRILGKLGEGGMGEVFRARDTKLNRDVALKVLPQALAADADRLARFTREAQTLAALNHPNIAGIYGIEETPAASGSGPASRALVMELVEGKDLSEIIAAGGEAPGLRPDGAPGLQARGIPIAEALPLARQIAEALEAAHDAGIVHRDLKPANIKIRRDGTVKVLDFGLAKAMHPGPEGPGLRPEGPGLRPDIPGLETDGGPGRQPGASSPTITSPARTQPGIILGTAAYMAPEQARGRPVDRRADIWAFGVVLYEMLTGRRAFAGNDVSEILAAVLRDTPSLEALPATTPPAIRRLLSRCLERDPRQRLQAIGEARVVLERAGQHSGDLEAATVAQAGSTATRRSVLRGSALLLAGAAIGAGLLSVPWLTRSTPEVAKRPVRAVVSLPPDATLSIGRGSAVALSPDGRRLALAGRSAGISKLYVRPLDQFEAQVIDGTEGATNPFFSPDGRWVAFFSQGKLKKVSLDGGAPVTVTDAANPRGEAWADDGTILFTPSNNTGVVRVPAAGGPAEPLTTLRAGELSHRWPRTLAGSTALLFTVWNDTGWEPAKIVAERTGTHERTVVIPAGGGYGRYVRDGSANHGFLVYARAEGLLAARFDESRLALTSQPVPVVDGVITNLSGGAHFDLSATGTLAYVPGALREADRDLQWVALDGTATPALQSRSISRFWTLSPDGTRVARNNTTGPNRDIWIEDLTRHTTARLTSAGDNYNAIWSRDGQWIVFARGIPSSNLYRQLADGSGRVERLTSSGANQAPSSVSPDGTTLLYSEFDALSGSDIWALTLPPTGSAGQTEGAAGRDARPLVKTTFSEGNAVFSPDGRWVAYQSNESGRFEVYLRSFEDSSQRVQVSTSGGIWPVWAPSGRDLLYRGTGGTIMAAAVVPGPGPRVDAPRLLLDGSRYDNVFAIAPDGTRLLMMPLLVAEQSATQIHLVLDFLEELRERLK